MHADSKVHDHDVDHDDFGQLLVALRAIFHQANTLKMRRIPKLSAALHAHRALIYLEDLPGMIRNVFEDPEVLVRTSRSRVFAPSSLPLSDESVCFMNGITKSMRDAHVYASSRLHAWCPAKIEPISHISGGGYRKQNSKRSFRRLVSLQTVKGVPSPINAAAPKSFNAN